MNVTFTKWIAKVHDEEMWIQEFIWRKRRVSGWLQDQNECATATKTSKQTSAISDLEFCWNIISRSRKITVFNLHALYLERG